MWVMLNDAWLSIVTDRDNEEFLLVRSRIRGAVAQTFGVEEFEDLEADYQFRAFVQRDQVAGAISREVLGINYPNFKNSVKDPQLHKAYSNVWTIGWRVQLENQDKGIQRRRFQPIMSSSTADTWPPETCSWCQEDIDHSFHAPEPGQPADVCEPCWSANGKEVLNQFVQEEGLEEEDFSEDELDEALGQEASEESTAQKIKAFFHPEA